MAHLRHAHGTLHGPEVRVGQRDIHRLQLDRMPHFTPVGGDHVGGGFQAGGAAKLCHHFAAGIPVFRTARIFRIRQNLMLIPAQADRFLE